MLVLDTQLRELSPGCCKYHARLVVDIEEKQRKRRGNGVGEKKCSENPLCRMNFATLWWFSGSCRNNPPISNCVDGYLELHPFDASIWAFHRSSHNQRAWETPRGAGNV